MGENGVKTPKDKLMIDTIKLSMQYGTYEIFDGDKFTPSVKSFNFTKGRTKCVQNPTKKELERGIYKPRLTLSRWPINGGWNTGLFIEFSAPKLVYGNNFSEVSESDFEKIIDVLHSKLYEMGVSVEKEDLARANVSSIHPCKNIHLQNSTSRAVISTMQRLRFPKRLDNCVTDFRNDGQILRIHADSYEFAGYDKKKDLLQSKISEKRAIEKDNKIQVGLLDNTLLDEEIFRIEVRINKPKKLKDVLSKCDMQEKELIFRELFNKEASVKILNYFWGIFIEPSLDTVLLSEETDKELRLRIKNAGFGQHKTLKLLGALNTIKLDGFAALRNELNDRAYYRLLKDLEILNQYRYNRANVFKDIKNCIDRMYPLRL